MSYYEDMVDGMMGDDEGLAGVCEEILADMGELDYDDED